MCKFKTFIDNEEKNLTITQDIEPDIIVYHDIDDLDIIFLIVDGKETEIEISVNSLTTKQLDTILDEIYDHCENLHSLEYKQDLADYRADLYHDMIKDGDI